MSTIYDYIKSEEATFETDEIQVGDNWFWNFRKHVQLIFHLVNGVFFTGENDWLRAFKNIMEPIIALSSWTEYIEVKEIVFYTEEDDNRALSFLVKKYHEEIYIKEHNIDAMVDQLTETDLTYGGVIAQKGTDCPEVMPLQSIAFCDQTDVLGGPIAFKYFFSPDKLRGMSKFGWGKSSNGATISIEDLIVLSTATKEAASLGQQKNRVTGKTIEVYIMRGNLPESYLKDGGDEEIYFNQIQIVAMYTDQKNEKQGVTLYRKKEAEGNLKFFTSKEVYMRGLGRGVGEGLLHPQIWTNFLTIHKTNMLEAASKVPLYTDDASYTTKNKIQDMENLEITTIEDGKRIYQVPTAAPANLQLIEGDVNTWYAQAQLTGAAQDPILGVQPASGTTFRGQERTVAQGNGIHNKRKGQRAKFIEEIYMDWILPDIVKEINTGKKFLATLSTQELSWVADQVATNEANKRIKQLVLDGKMITKDEQDALTQTLKASFLKKGNKHLLEALKGEFSDVKFKISVDVAGKQKDIAALSDKILSIFQYVFANPSAFQSAMQIPALAKAFENILELSGLSIADFSSLLTAPQVQAPQVDPNAPQSQSQTQAQPLTLNAPQANAQ